MKEKLDVVLNTKDEVNDFINDLLNPNNEFHNLMEDILDVYFSEEKKVGGLFCSERLILCSIFEDLDDEDYDDITNVYKLKTKLDIFKYILNETDGNGSWGDWENHCDSLEEDGITEDEFYDLYDVYVGKIRDNYERLTNDKW